MTKKPTSKGDLVMRAALISRHGGPEVLEFKDLPSPKPKAGELLVKVGAAGVNYRDIFDREGVVPHELPFILGLEGAGTVIEVGDAVSGFAPGDRVGWASCFGSYAEQALIPAEKAVPLPHDISDELAASILLQGITAHYLVTSAAAPLSKDDWVLVHAAAGGVGLLLVQLAKAQGAHVIGTTSSQAKADLARAAGADHVIDYEGFGQRARELSGGGVAVVYDSVGRSTFDDSLTALRSRGTLLLFGAASGMPEPFDIFRLWDNSLSVRANTMFSYVETRQELLRRAHDVFEWVRNGTFKASYKSYPLEQANRALEELHNRRTTGKLVLLPQG